MADEAALNNAYRQLADRTGQLVNMLNNDASNWQQAKREVVDHVNQAKAYRDQASAIAVDHIVPREKGGTGSAGYEMTMDRYNLDLNAGYRGYYVSGWNNCITDGNDNGSDLGQGTANVTVRTWWGFGIACTLEGGGGLRWLCDSRTGDVRQTGSLIFRGDGDREVHNQTGNLNLRCSQGDVLVVGGHNQLSYNNSAGETRFKVDNGHISVGTIGVRQVEGVTGLANTENGQTVWELRPSGVLEQWGWVDGRDLAPGANFWYFGKKFDTSRPVAVNITSVHRSTWQQRTVMIMPHEDLKVGFFIGDLGGNAGEFTFHCRAVGFAGESI